jgi:virulence-associated protein VagC
MMRNNVYLSVCVLSMAIVAAWWNLEQSDRKSLPEGTAGLVVEERVTVSQPEVQSKDVASMSVRGKNGKRDEHAELEVGKGAKQTGVEKDSVSGIEKSLPDDDKRVENESADVAFDSVAKSGPQAQAVRLADDFALPAAMMHMAAIEAGHEGAGPLTPQIKAAVDHLVDDFYRDVAQTGEPDSDASVGTEVSSQEQSEFNSTVESSEETRVIAPTEEAMDATEKANQRHQLLFGDDAANRFGIQSKLEARLPVQGQE